MWCRRILRKQVSSKIILNCWTTLIQQTSKSYLKWRYEMFSINSKKKKMVWFIYWTHVNFCCDQFFKYFELSENQSVFGHIFIIYFFRDFWRSWHLWHWIDVKSISNQRPLVFEDFELSNAYNFLNFNLFYILHLGFEEKWTTFYAGNIPLQVGQ